MIKDMEDYLNKLEMRSTFYGDLYNALDAFYELNRPKLDHEFEEYSWDIDAVGKEYIVFRGKYDTGDSGVYMYDHATLTVPVRYLFDKEIKSEENKALLDSL